MTLALTANVFGQRYCGSELNLVQMQQTDPVRYQRIMTMENQLQAYLNNPVVRSIPQSTIIIPVVVHVVYNSSAQNISDAQINSQIQVLNEDFRRLNADRTNTPSAFASVAGDANIEFRLAKIDPNGNPTTGITRTQTSVSGFSQTSDNVKFTNSGGRNAWNTQRYLNIWVCNFSNDGLKGYATFPDQLSTNPNNDGVVISFKWFGRNGSAEFPYDRGRTATHELGHWLNLRHIWGDAHNCSATDHVNDTPNQYEQHWGCPSFPTTDDCTTSNPGIMFMNYMDYTNDACMNLFTNGQIARMRALFDTQTGIRREMLTHANAITNPPPTLSGPSSLCSGSSGTFTVSNPPAGFTWSCSSNLTKTSGSGNTAIFLAGANGAGWVSIRTGNTEVARANVQVGVPDRPWIMNGSTIYKGSSATYTMCIGQGTTSLYLSFINPDNSVDVSYWEVEQTLNPNDFSLVLRGNNLYVNPLHTGGGIFKVRSVNNCGTSSEFIVYLTINTCSGGTFPIDPPSMPHLTSMYPNPASDLLTIEIKTAEAKMPPYILQLWHEKQGLVHSIESTKNVQQISLRGLPRGLYFMHLVVDGKNIQQEKLMVQ
jgi:hypothetical protein